MPEMQTFNACFVGDIDWFSERKTKGKYKSVKDALKAHLNYISRSQHTIKVYGINFNRWKELADEELETRWDARVAGKFFLTLPNDLTVEKALEIVKTFVEGWIGTREYTIALHLNKGFISGEDNLHAHIVFFPRDQRGKKIFFDREKLRQFHKAWREHLQKYGYVVPEVPDELKRRKVIIDRKNPDPEMLEQEREYYLLRKQTLSNGNLKAEEKTQSEEKTHNGEEIKRKRIVLWTQENNRSEEKPRGEEIIRKRITFWLREPDWARKNNRTEKDLDVGSPFL